MNDETTCMGDEIEPKPGLWHRFCAFWLAVLSAYCDPFEVEL